MTAETREDLALKVLQAFADIEDTTSLESKAHLERIQGYTRDERNAMVSELIKLSYIVNEAFNHGILEHGIICLERGYVFTDSVLVMKKAQAKEESRHNELVSLQKEANELVKKANKAAFMSSVAAGLSVFIAALSLLLTFVISIKAKDNDKESEHYYLYKADKEYSDCQPIDSLKN